MCSSKYVTWLTTIYELVRVYVHDCVHDCVRVCVRVLTSGTVAPTDYISGRNSKVVAVLVVVHVL